MAQYLQGAIERVLQEKLHGDANLRTDWAWSFRRGASANIVSKLREKRRQYLSEEEKKREKAERAASGASTSTAITVASFAKSEEEANDDFRFGEGFSAAKAAARAADAEHSRKMYEAYTKWAKENPREAQEKFSWTDDNGRTWTYGRSRRYGGDRSEPKAKDMSAYYSGYDAADGISLDQQVDTGGNRRIGRSK